MCTVGPPGSLTMTCELEDMTMNDNSDIATGGLLVYHINMCNAAAATTNKNNNDNRNNHNKTNKGKQWISFPVQCTKYFLL